MFISQPDDLRCGVVIGSYDFPKLVELQIKTIRYTCGDVPILIADDCSPDSGFLNTLPSLYPGVTLWPNPQRIGHTGGDISVFWKGIIWGNALGLQTVAKLSQRFITTKSRWLQTVSKDLLQSTLPVASQKSRGLHIFDLRTEACVMDVQQWYQSGILKALQPRQFGQPLVAENIIFKAIQDYLGGKYLPWLLFTEHRNEVVPDVYWHYANSARDYEQLSSFFGVKLDDHFHIEGWQRHKQEGKYLYG